MILHRMRSCGLLTRSLGLVACLAVCLTSMATHVWAQQSPAESSTSGKPWFEGTTEEQRQQARTIFLEGNRLINMPAFAEAAKKYKEAIEIWDNPAFHYNLAIAQINLLQPPEAYESLQKALRYGAAPLGDDKHERALEYMKSLEAQLARVRITCNQPGSEISLDGKPLFTGPGTYVGVVQPGAHQLVASKEGYFTESRQLVGTPGEETAVVLRLRKPDQVLTVRRWAAWKPWAVTGASLMLLGGAAYLDYRSSADFDQFDADFGMLCAMGCQGDQVPSQLIGDLDNAKTTQSIALATYAAGSALLITGAVLLYVNRERVVRIKDEDRPTDVVWAPAIIPNGAVLSTAIRF